MNDKISIMLVVMPILFTPAFSNADTLYFKGGGTIEGIIKSENPENIEMDIGFGTITCSKNEVIKVDRSTGEEITLLTEKWDKKREELKNSEADFARERKRRFEEYDKWTKEESLRAAREAEAGSAVDLYRDPESKSILVNAAINGKVNATLVLDTGASIVVLTKQKGAELGIDLTNAGNNIATLQLAGEHRVSAKMVMLKSVRINNIEVNDVMAGILLEDGGMGFRDGLLGMTFLNRFNLKIDLKNMKMSLEKAA